MKRTMCAWAMVLGLGTVGLAQRQLALDPAGSKVTWTGKKVTGSHTGGIDVSKGGMTWDANGLLTASVVIDMNTITCTDLSGGGAAKLVGHLKSADFFDVAGHPTATFTSSKVEPIQAATAGRPNYRVTGDLTIKGITHPLTFDVLAVFDGTKAKASANLVFDRSKYDVRFGSASFFDSLGDKAISDEVELTFDVTAK